MCVYGAVTRDRPPSQLVLFVPPMRPIPVGFNQENLSFWLSQLKSNNHHNSSIKCNQSNACWNINKYSMILAIVCDFFSFFSPYKPSYTKPLCQTLPQCLLPNKILPASLKKPWTSKSTRNCRPLRSTCPWLPGPNTPLSLCQVSLNVAIPHPLIWHDDTVGLEKYFRESAHEVSTLMRCYAVLAIQMLIVCRIMSIGERARSAIDWFVPSTLSFIPQCC